MPSPLLGGALDEGPSSAEKRRRRRRTREKDSRKWDTINGRRTVRKEGLPDDALYKILFFNFLSQPDLA